MHDHPGDPIDRESHGNYRAEAQAHSRNTQRRQTQGASSSEKQSAYADEDEGLALRHDITLASPCRQNNYKGSKTASHQTANDGRLLDFSLRTASEYRLCMPEEAGDRDHAGKDANGGAKVASDRSGRSHRSTLEPQNPLLARTTFQL